MGIVRSIYFRQNSRSERTSLIRCQVRVMNDFTMWMRLTYILYNITYGGSIMYVHDKWKRQLTSTTCPRTDFRLRGSTFFRPAHMMPGTNSNKKTVISKKNLIGHGGSNWKNMSGIEKSTSRPDQMSVKTEPRTRCFLNAGQ
jgi:hypothetical protein